MKIPNIRNLSFFGIFILIVLNVTKSNACSCDTASFINAIEFSDEIFVGKVIKVEEYKNGQFVKTTNQEQKNYPLRYYFEVEKKWKGNEKSTLIIDNYGSCFSFWFDVGEKYLVYAKRDTVEEEPIVDTTSVIDTGTITIVSNFKINDGKDALSTWSCSRTIQSKNWIWENNRWYQGDLKRLDKEFPNQLSFEQKKSNKRWLIIGGFLFSMIFLFLIRRMIQK